MLKKYFEDDSYNIMPCGVVAFQNDSTLKIISANTIIRLMRTEILKVLIFVKKTKIL